MPWGEFEGDVNSSDIPQYLVKSYIPGDNITAERMNIARVISSCPKKVQDAITAGTQIVVGKYSASGYDYINDVLHIAKGAFPEEIAHEIGHLIDNKLISKRDRDVLLKKVVSDCKPTDVFNESFYDNLGNKIDVLCVHSNKFVSVYQGRTYVKRYRDAFNDDYSVNIEPMIEFVSEMFREYWLDSNNLKINYPKYYKLIEDAVK